MSGKELRVYPMPIVGSQRLYLISLVGICCTFFLFSSGTMYRFLSVGIQCTFFCSLAIARWAKWMAGRELRARAQAARPFDKRLGDEGERRSILSTVLSALKRSWAYEKSAPYNKEGEGEGGKG